MSKHSVHSGDVTGLLNHFTRLQAKAQACTGKGFPVIVIHEAGLARPSHRGVGSDALAQVGGSAG